MKRKIGLSKRCFFQWLLVMSKCSAMTSASDPESLNKLCNEYLDEKARLERMVKELKRTLKGER